MSYETEEAARSAGRRLAAKLTAEFGSGWNVFQRWNSEIQRWEALVRRGVLGVDVQTYTYSPPTYFAYIYSSDDPSEIVSEFMGSSVDSPKDAVKAALKVAQAVVDRKTALLKRAIRDSRRPLLKRKKAPTPYQEQGYTLYARGVKLRGSKITIYFFSTKRPLPGPPRARPLSQIPKGKKVKYTRAGIPYLGAAR